MDKEIMLPRFPQDEFDKLKLALVKYNCALAIVMTKLNNLDAYYHRDGGISPIDHLMQRIKSPESIAAKLLKKNLPLTAEEAQKKLKDIAGVRIICSYAKNIYELAEVLRAQDDFNVVSEKDYLTEPKQSGYRSYHMIMEVKLGGLFGDEVCLVEIQLRTAAMDFWAQLEHKVRYKYGGDMPQHLSDELQNCAEQIHILDDRMYLIHEIVEMINDPAIAEKN
ncbi:MAG TPA: GTP pyrophosphokinase family protein [Lactovum miscens]|uniref:GTP pyrophosphokinase n=1 Tax=Lactovum miscens TaxID=190387 RepID=UPI002ED9DD6E